MKLISIITPMYNEAPVIDDYFIKLESVLQNITDKNNGISFEIITVNDGSNDKTLETLKKWHEIRGDVTIINLSRNFGQEPAVFAGLEKASGDAAIVMDCDMQDPPELIALMADKFLEGYDVVNAKRVKRAGDTVFKRGSAIFYYKLLNRLSYKVKYPENVNNFRLISRKVIDAVLSMPERNKFFRGLVPFTGFKSCEIEFERQDRLKGKSKYNLGAMVRLAIDGITSATIKPLYYSAAAGAAVFCAGIAASAALIVLYLCGTALNYTLFGVIAALAVFTGINLTALGILSIYNAKIYEETKRRPFSITESIIEKKKRF